MRVALAKNLWYNICNTQKGCEMFRVLRTFLASLLFLTVTTLVGYAAYFFNISDFWTMFGIASGVLVAGILIGIVKQTAAKIVSFFVNAVAMGFYLQSWYINRGFDNSVWLMLGVALLAATYMLVFALPLLIPVVNRHYGIYLTVFVLLSLGGYVSLVVLTKTTWVSTLGYFGLLQLSFILGSSFSCSDWDDEVRALWLSSYSVVVCAVIILAIVAGGDGCDASCDCGGTRDVSSPIKSKKGSKDLPNKL